MRLLLTRPVEDGARTAQSLRAGGHDVMLAPLVSIEAIADAAIPIGAWTAVLMTSANAARVFAQRADHAAYLDLPVFAVGDQTAKAAQAAGFRKVVSARGDAHDLAASVSAAVTVRPARLLYLAAAIRAQDVAALLAPHGITVETVAIYRAIAAERLPPEAGAALTRGEIDGVLHYSRRSAEAFLRCAEAMQLGPQIMAIMHYCLAEAVAEPLRAKGIVTVRIAERPDEAALLQLLSA